MANTSGIEGKRLASSGRTSPVTVDVNVDSIGKWAYISITSNAAGQRMQLFAIDAATLRAALA